MSHVSDWLAIQQNCFFLLSQNKMTLEECEKKQIKCAHSTENQLNYLFWSEMSIFVNCGECSSTPTSIKMS